MFIGYLFKSVDIYNINNLVYIVKPYAHYLFASIVLPKGLSYLSGIFKSFPVT